MPNYILGCDISRWQGRPDFAKLVDDGMRYIVVKATQGGSVDPDYEWNMNQAVAHNMPAMVYPFLNPGDTDATIEHFVGVVGKGAVAALDWEQAGVSNQVVGRWMDICEEQLGRPGLVYRGEWPPAPMTSRIAKWPLWFAEYPSNPNASPRIPLWDGTGIPDWTKQALIWQYTGNGRLPGVTAEIDLDRMLCPWDVFEGWYKTGTIAGLAAVPINVTPFNAPTVARTLFVGCSGADVALLQTKIGVAPDGAFGPQTKNAVMLFQSRKGLAMDGIAGPDVFAALAAQ